MAGGFCPDVLHVGDEIEHTKRLSKRLYRVMENNGVTAEARDAHTEMVSLSEIMGNFIYPTTASLTGYKTGSWYEGTYETESDVDMVFVQNSMPIATKISNCPHPSCFLLVPDKQPGYFKLQLNLHREPISNDTYLLPEPLPNFILKPDKDQRLCLIRILPGEGLLREYPGYRHGPAYRQAIKSIDNPRKWIDSVHGLKGEDWPDCASEWLTRRDTRWPSEDLITKCKSLGFFVVNACHPASNEKEFQWRISFTLQERLLVTKFNSVQLKCYRLLKLIKKTIIEPEVKDTLTSYHCKTCMFYMLENTRSELWIPENLVTCLLMCLQKLRTYVLKNNCPNYFIPEENMFDRITSGKQREKLGEVLERILKTLTNLFDQLIQFLSIEMSEQDIQYQSEDVVNEDVLKAKEMFIVDLSLSWMGNLVYSKSLEDFKDHLMDTLDQVREATIAYHTEAEMDLAKSLILPFIRVHLLSCNLVSALLIGSETVQKIPTRSEAVQKILTSKEWEQQAPITGYSRLKQAAAMLMLKHHEGAIDVLLSIPDYSHKFFCCGCKGEQYSSPLQELQKAVGNRPDINVIELLNDFYQLCVNFLPLEQKITPTALQYEMVRDFGMPHISPDDRIYLFWHDWGVVNENFLYHFLLHLNYQALGENSQAGHQIKEMIYLLNSHSVSHRETCLNLLGWAHKERGDNTLAVQCFTKSLETAYQHNAACWHLCFLICGY